MIENTNNSNEINIKFFPLVTIKVKKAKKDEEKEKIVPYEANVKVSGFTRELTEFFRWLISFVISHCARKYGNLIYRIQLEKKLDEDVSHFIPLHCVDIIDSDIKQISLEFDTISNDPCVRQVIEDLEYKLLEMPFRSMERDFYTIKRGCNLYSRAKSLGREDDISTIMEIFKNPDHWYMFRDWKSPHDKYYVD